jgi:hypothetical protein
MAERLELAFLEMPDTDTYDISDISEYNSLRGSTASTPIPTTPVTDLFGTPSQIATPTGMDMCTTPDLQGDLHLSDDSSTDEEVVMALPTETNDGTAETNDTSASSSSSSLYMKEEDQDLSFHIRPYAENIDCLAQLDKKFTDQLDSVQKEVIRVGHSLSKFVALHGKVSMTPYVNVLDSIQLQLEEFMAPFLIYHKVEVTPQIRH